MANCLTMDSVHNVLALHKLGWSDRRIARELGIHRETVARHVRLSRPATNLPTGSSAHSEPANNLPAGSAGVGALPGAVPQRDSEVQPPTDGGFIALLPTAQGGSVDAARRRVTLLSSGCRRPNAAPLRCGKMPVRMRRTLHDQRQSEGHDEGDTDTACMRGGAG